MRIQTFRAPRLHEALAEVRKSLGADALILDKRRERENGQSVWVVQAAKDPDAAGAPLAPEPAPVEQPSPKGWEEALERIEQVLDRLSRKDAEAFAEGLEGAARQAHARLVRIGVAPPLARELAEDLGAGRPLSAAQLRWAERFAPHKRPEVLLMLGPRGAGKTTLVAKLASWCAMRDVPVAVASTDTERVGGTEMLAAYAQIIGCPCVVLDTPEASARLRGKARVLLVDSEGIGTTEEARRQWPIWEALAPTRRLWVMPATLDEEDGMALLQLAKHMRADHLAITCLDLTRRPGKVLNWAAASALKLSFCSFGADVPERTGWLAPDTVWAALFARGRKA
ncbi:MAG: hypothetical protein D6771_01685 [Zetaproteobacteria bacterium]|nr:MAG: hypothetical protein D6771_01685 [Zetaproteobacteria bacterium]